MKKISFGKTLARLISSLLPAAVLCYALDAAITLLWRPVPVAIFVVALAALTGLFFFPRISVKRRLVILLVIVLVCVLLVGAAGIIWYRFYKNSAYRNVDSGKSAIYADQNVMVIVPHQDDDLNLLSGVFEEYERYGSRVCVVFVTTGDYSDIGEARMREALDVLAHCGVENDDVIFLGYGNEWQGTNIYNAPGDEVLTSHAGYTETYGLPEHPAYRGGIVILEITLPGICVTLSLSAVPT